jgi:hypothetical protein
LTAHAPPPLLILVSPCLFFFDQIQNDPEGLRFPWLPQRIGQINGTKFLRAMSDEERSLEALAATPVEFKDTEGDTVTFRYNHDGGGGGSGSGSSKLACFVNGTPKITSLTKLNIYSKVGGDSRIKLDGMGCVQGISTTIPQPLVEEVVPRLQELWSQGKGLKEVDTDALLDDVLPRGDSSMLGKDSMLSMSPSLTEGGDGSSPLLRNRILCLYFGAPRWCAPCKKFSQPEPDVRDEKTGQLLKRGKKSPLSQIHDTLRERQQQRQLSEQFEFVYLCVDEEDDAFDEHARHFPGFVVPQAEQKRSLELATRLGVKKIPSLVILDRDGETVINGDAIYAASNHGADKFPWQPLSVAGKGASASDTSKTVGSRRKRHSSNPAENGDSSFAKDGSSSSSSGGAKDAANTVEEQYVVTVIGASRHRLEAFGNSINFSAALDGARVRQRCEALYRRGAMVDFVSMVTAPAASIYLAPSARVDVRVDADSSLVRSVPLEFVSLWPYSADGERNNNSNNTTSALHQESAGGNEDAASSNGASAAAAAASSEAEEMSALLKVGARVVVRCGKKSGMKPGVVARVRDSTPAPAALWGGGRGVMPFCGGGEDGGRAKPSGRVSGGFQGMASSGGGRFDAVRVTSWDAELERRPEQELWADGTTLGGLVLYLWELFGQQQQQRYAASANNNAQQTNNPLMTAAATIGKPKLPEYLYCRVGGAGGGFVRGLCKQRQRRRPVFVSLRRRRRRRQRGRRVWAGQLDRRGGREGRERSSWWKCRFRC